MIIQDLYKIYTRFIQDKFYYDLSLKDTTVNMGASHSATAFHSILHCFSQTSSLINSKESVKGIVVISTCILNGLCFHLKHNLSVYFIYGVLLLLCSCWLPAALL